MKNWIEIEKRFREIAPLLSDVRLDYQWGDAGVYWNLSGGYRNANFEQFKMLTLLAGQLLEKSLPKSDSSFQKIFTEETFEGRWYRAIWDLTNKQENHMFAVMKNDNGEDAGHIYSAMVFKVVDVSANLCLKLHALYPIVENSTHTPNINISGGNIGILNAGKMEEIQSIVVNISNLREMGHNELATAIDNLIKAVETNNEINTINKQEIIEQLSELSNQAIQPPEKRLKPSIIKSLLSGLGTSISITSDLSQIWSVWGPIIVSFFLR